MITRHLAQLVSSPSYNLSREQQGALPATLRQQPTAPHAPSPPRQVSTEKPQIEQNSEAASSSSEPGFHFAYEEEKYPEDISTYVDEHKRASEENALLSSTSHDIHKDTEMEGAFVISTEVANKPEAESKEEETLASPYDRNILQQQVAELQEAITQQKDDAFRETILKNLGIVENPTAEEIVTHLLEDKNIDPNKPHPDNGLTPLHLAARLGNVKVVQMLLEHQRVDVNKRRLNHGTALMHACSGGHVPVVQLFLQTPRVDIHACDPDGDNCFNWACQSGHVDVMRCLLEDGRIETGCISKDGRNALHFCVQSGSVKGVKLLLERGIAQQLSKGQDDKNRTPLDMAKELGNEEMVALFKAYFASSFHPSSTEEKEETSDTNEEELQRALAMSMEETDSKKEEKEEAAGDDALSLAQPELPSLHQAVQQKEYGLVETLLSTSPDLAQTINERDHLGRTPLDLAPEGSQLYQLLQSKGAFLGK